MALPVDKGKWILQLVMLEDRVVSVIVRKVFRCATKDVREKICKDHGSKTDSLKTEKIKQKQKQTGGGRRRPSEQRLQRQAAAPVSAERRGSVTPPE